MVFINEYLFSYWALAHFVFKNNFLATWLVILSYDGWGVELWIVPCVPLLRNFGNGKIADVKNLFTNFGL